jgi:FixJ family two-component response regulator
MVGVEGTHGETLEQALCAAGWKVSRMSASEVQLSHENIFAAPTCLVVDVTDSQLSELLFRRRLEMAVVCITDEGSVAMTVLAMKAGAVDVIARPVEAEVLVRAVGSALEHSAARLARDREVYALRKRYASLTLRERQVMALVISGKLNKQIGGELGISEITVKAHRGRVMRKMDARTLVGLVQVAAKIETGTTSLEAGDVSRPAVATDQAMADLRVSRWSDRFAQKAASPQAHADVATDDPVSRLRLVG